MKLFDTFFPEFSGREIRDLWDVRNWFTRKILLVVIFIFPIAVSYTLWIFFNEGRYGLIAVDIGIWLLLVFRFLFAPKDSYHINTVLWVALIYTLTVTFFVELGPHYARSGWLVMCVVLSTVHYGVMGTIVATVVNVGILVLLYGLIPSADPAWADVFNAPLRQWIMFVVNISIISLVSGLQVGILLDWLDLSLKHRRESEEKYRLLAENATDVIWTFHLESMRFTYISPSILQLNGYSHREAMELPPEQWLSPKSLEQVRETLREELANESREGVDPRRSKTLEMQQVRKDGSHEWTEAIMSFLRNPEGKPIGVLGVTRNITDRKRAEKALHESERRFRELAELLPETVYETDGTGTLTFMNQNAFDRFGYTQEDFAGGLNALNMIIPDDRGRALENFQIIMSGEPAGPNEYTMQRKDGKTFPAMIHSTAIAREGKHVGLRGLIVDMTKRRLAEVEKAKLENQLIQSQKMESVGRLAGGVAHDFNNMLGVILGHAEMAIAQTDPEQPLHTGLREIRKAAERSAALTNQLLAFARRQTIMPKVINLNEAVAAMLKMLQRLIGEEIDLRWRSEANLWSIKVDPTQIDQILANLCVNARDAIAGIGNVTIEAGNTTFDEAYCGDHEGFVPGDYVLLAVSDDGCGMDKETTDRIFEPFFTTKAGGQGTGLGLATVYGIVKQNNGFINVYSEPGHGTTFKIYLPRHIGEADEVRTEELQEPFKRGRETVLVVEDEPSLLELSKLMLEEQGYRVLAAGTPGEAISLADAHDGYIHLLMTDVVMPEMNGRELASRMLSVYPHIRCLFTSGYTTNVIAYRGVLDEGVNFIQKPFSRRDLTAKVREVLDKK